MTWGIKHEALLLYRHLLRPRNNRLIKIDGGDLMWCLVGKKKWVRFGWLVIRFENQRIR